MRKKALKIFVAAMLLVLVICLSAGLVCAAGTDSAEAVATTQNVDAPTSSTVTYAVVIAVLTYLAEEILKWRSVPTKYIPAINMGIGVCAALICYFTGIMPSGTLQLFMADLVTCLIATMGAGGFYDLLKSGGGLKATSADQRTD